MYVRDKGVKLVNKGYQGYVVVRFVVRINHYNKVTNYH